MAREDVRETCDIIVQIVFLDYSATSGRSQTLAQSEIVD
jgi:hypothetical protein